MTKVLFAWEIGGGLGHVMRAAAFARELKRQGAQVVVALKDLTNCHLAKWPNDIKLLQAPLPGSLLNKINNQANFGEILYTCGYHEQKQINALIAEWQNLIDLVEPDVVVTDHAPTAHLAARLSQIRVARIGTGFFAPPPISPTPRFRTWQPVDERRMKLHEARVVKIINAILVRHKMPPASSLSLVLAPDLDLITSWPELDCYFELRPQNSVAYVGNERTTGQGITPQWPRSAALGKKKIVAYLKGDFGQIDTVLNSLRHGYATVAYVTNFTDQLRQRFATDDLWLAPGPMDISIAAKDCDAAICHGGAGTAPLFLEAGKPVLLLPYQAEQRTNSEKIAATGAGMCLNDESVKNSFGIELARFLADAGFGNAARAIAERWSDKEDAVCVATGKILQMAANITLPTSNVSSPNPMPDVNTKPFSKAIPAMQVEVTTRCNFDCFYCAGRDMLQKDMDYDSFCKLLDQHISNFGVPPYVSLQGEGEPTINRDFFRMAARVKEVGSHPYTITNGTHKDWQEFLPLFDSIGVSMDTLDEEEAKKIGRYNLPRVQKFIEDVAAHIPVIVHTVNLGPSAQAVEKWCKERGIRHIVQPLQNKADYQYRYPQFIARKIKEEKFSCVYLRTDSLRYYNLDGAEMPCAFIKSTKNYSGIVEMKRLQQAGQRPTCCTGCTMNGPKET